MANIKLKTGVGIPPFLEVGEPAFDIQNNVFYIGDINGVPINIIDFNLSKKQMGVGKKYYDQNGVEQGEIFNDYENNQALSLNSHAEGENTNAGTKAFKIASSFTNNGSGTIKFNLNSSEGLNDNLIGTPCTLRVANEFSNGITISGYDTIASTITLKGVPADATYETDSDDASTHTVENFIVIQGHPELGDTDVGHNAHAGGYNTLAQGRETFAAGRDNKVVGQYGAVTGRENIVGHGAFASGRKNTALGTMSHAEGSETKAIGSCAHAEGKNTESYGTYSHAEGSYTKAHGDFTHSEGYRSTASGEASHAEGGDTTAEGNYSHAEGYSSYAKGINTHSEGNNTYAEGSASHAEGTDSQSVGQSSHAEGRGTLANGTNSHSEGNSTEARGNHSHAEGVKSRTGNADNTGGYASHAEGNETEATGSSSHSEGNQTHATASCSHAEGNNTYARGSASHAEGAYTIAASAYQHVQGKYNVVDSEGTYAHIIGNGTGNADDQRKNIHTVDWDGNAWFAGKVTVGANNAELATVDKVNEISNKLSSVYTFKGSVDYYQDLPKEAITGDTYKIKYDSSNGFESGFSEKYYFKENASQSFGDNLSLTLPINNKTIDYLESMENIIINFGVEVSDGWGTTIKKCGYITVPKYEWNGNNSGWTIGWSSTLDIDLSMSEIGSVYSFIYEGDGEVEDNDFEALKNIIVNDYNPNTYDGTILESQYNVNGDIQRGYDSNFHVASAGDLATKTDDGWTILPINTNVYTKEQIDSKGYLTEHQDISEKANKSDVYTKEEVNNKLSSVYKYKGTIDYYFDLPQSSEIGDVYNIRYASGENYYTETKLYYDYSVDSSSELPPFSDYGLEGLAVIIPMSLNDFNNLKAQGDTVIVDISVDYRFEIPIRDSCPEQATSCLCRLDDSNAFLIIVSTEEPFNQGTLYLSIKGYLENEKPPFRFNESVDIYPSEPYLINDSDNVAWTGTEWDVLAGTEDMSLYAQTDLSNVDNATFKAKAESAGVGGGSIDLSDCEKISNKTTEINADSTDDQYPSAKAVWEVTKNAGGTPTSFSSIILNSSTEGSTKQFKITIDDNGKLTARAVEVNE